MKFGKSLLQVIELSDPEWSPFWINYKYLKRKIRDIIDYHDQLQTSSESRSVEQQRKALRETAVEVEFFRCLKKELKKVANFFSNCEAVCKIRKDRLWDGLSLLKKQTDFEDDGAWSRMLAACVKFYKDVLLLENYAIMNYCGFSKILKKHDKRTGFSTRDAYLTKVVSQENFTKYPFIKRQLREIETIFEEIQSLHNVGEKKQLSEEEQLFIDAIRDLNYQAAQIQSEEAVSVESPQTGAAVSDEAPVLVVETAPREEDRAEGSAGALLEASIRANVLDPLPDMPAILSWMQSVSSSSLAPATSRGAFKPRGLDTTTSRGSPVCEGGIRYEPSPFKKTDTDDDSGSSDQVPIPGLLSPLREPAVDSSSSSSAFKRTRQQSAPVRLERSCSDESTLTRQGSTDPEAETVDGSLEGQKRTRLA